MQTPWIHAYPPGVRWDAELPQCSPLDLLANATWRWPERTAVDFMERRISYRELSNLVDRAATGLQRLGVGPGIHVGLLLPNAPHYLIAFFAVLRAGGCVVNYSPLDADEVIAHKIEDSDTDILVTLDLATLYPKAVNLLSRTRLRSLVVGSLGEFCERPEAVQARLEQQGQLSRVHYNHRCLPFTHLLSNDGHYHAHPLGDAARQLAVLQYTGGTTGLSKGAMLSQANLAAAVAQVVATNVTADTDDHRRLHEGRESVLAVLPLFHVYAMVCAMLFPIAIGAEIVLMAKFDPLALLGEIQQRRITCFPGVPTMFTALASHPEVERFDLSSLKVCVSGGAPLPLELLQRFQALTGCPLSEAWGMTETTACGTFTPTDGLRKPGSCGIPQPGLRLRLLDLDDPERDAADGCSGEIAVAGPNVTLGYWKQPEASLDSFTADGFFRTGDVGRLDADGYLYIVDRTKDMLLCGGFNVYPRVIEEAIYAHPAVEEVMVVGIPDAYRGQSPKAYIKLRRDQPPFGLEQLKEFLADRVGKHEMVQALEFRAELPKTAVGKLSKKLLLDEIAATPSAPASASA
ncbi:AMP-binding protein [Pseudomonas panipatensis]|uniref:Long-chain-fatty-acid--CoA ligase n=1 Tax=Pseudomonas panipatensis TaxID=428992 RepID=A0A1G8IMB9_9PSED|nr:AMP-binding protein [Pseudomonas panipatensis]SDI19650.1 long-chain acyl-CoA synthetase [Pseudomonas panipatensis]SMP73611.1 long-chain acyl-CoA synthetase [Pseudomonas panipatensis]